MDAFTGLIDFGIYFGIAIALLLAFKWAYALATPHDEWKLVKDEKSVAAAVAFGGAIVGFGLALSSAVTYSESLLDFVIWGGVALVAQVLAFLLVRIILLPKVSQRIEAGEVSAGIMLASVSIAVGLLNGASMSW